VKTPLFPFNILEAAMSIFDKAKARGWTINQGTLQAKGLWHAFKTPIVSDDDITVWCRTRQEAAKEALRMQAATDELNKSFLIIDARYAKGKMIIQPLDSKDGYKGRASYLAEALNGKWVHRSGGYTVSPAAADKFLKLFKAGFEANVRCFKDSPAEFYHRKLELESLTLKEALAKSQT
jgi:hypothetical protein